MPENTGTKMGQRQGLCGQWLIRSSHGQKPILGKAPDHLCLACHSRACCKGDLLTAARLPGVPGVKCPLAWWDMQLAEWCNLLRGELFLPSSSCSMMGAGKQDTKETVAGMLCKVGCPHKLWEQLASGLPGRLGPRLRGMVDASPSASPATKGPLGSAPHPDQRAARKPSYTCLLSA